MSHARPLTATRVGVAPDAVRPPGPATYARGIDWIAVERAASGTLDPDDLTDGERREAALLMRRAGVGRRTVARRLGVPETRLQKWEASDG